MGFVHHHRCVMGKVGDFAASDFEQWCLLLQALASGPQVPEKEIMTADYKIQWLPKPLPGLCLMAVTLAPAMPTIQGVVKGNFLPELVVNIRQLVSVTTGGRIQQVDKTFSLGVIDQVELCHVAPHRTYIIAGIFGQDCFYL